MQAVQFFGNREARVAERPDPTLLPGQVLVEMKRAAICGSDLHGYRRPPSDSNAPGRTPGHEPVGIVVQLGPEVTMLTAGQRVQPLPAMDAARDHPVRAAP